MASHPEDTVKADKAQRQLHQQVRACRLMVKNGRQLFMLAQATPKLTSR